MDNINSLIELIVAEVEKILTEEGYTIKRTTVENSDNSQSRSIRKKIIVVVTEGDVAQDEAINQIKSLADNYGITILLSQIATKIFDKNLFLQIEGINEVFTDDSDLAPIKLVNTNDLIVVPLLDFSNAAKLSLGIADSLSTNIILQSLINKKPVIAARNSLIPMKMESNPIVKLSKDYYSQLVDFGIKFVDVSRIAESVINYENGKVLYERNGNKKAVVTSSVILNISEHIDELIVDNPAIITHLAKEVAKNRGIKITIK